MARRDSDVHICIFVHTCVFNYDSYDVQEKVETECLYNFFYIFGLFHYILHVLWAWYPF